MKRTQPEWCSRRRGVTPGKRSLIKMDLRGGPKGYDQEDHTFRRDKDVRVWCEDDPLVPAVFYAFKKEVNAKYHHLMFILILILGVGIYSLLYILLFFAYFTCSISLIKSHFSVHLYLLINFPIILWISFGLPCTTHGKNVLAQMLLRKYGGI